MPRTPENEREVVHVSGLIGGDGGTEKQDGVNGDGGTEISGLIGGS